MRYLILVIALCFCSFNASAYFVDGNDLVRNMREWDNANRNSQNTNYRMAASYTSYVQGVNDSLDLNHLICSGTNATVGQVGAVVKRFLESKPERWAEPAFFLVSDALKEAFPCSQ